VSAPGEHENELLRRVLARAQEPPHSEHLDEELIALFAEDGLSADERARVVEHLADCAQCRRAASSLVSLNDELASFAQDRPTIRLPRPESERSSSRRRVTLLALAASLLVAVTIALNGWRSSGLLAERNAYDAASQLLASSEFAQARHVISEAAERGTRSDRLQSLDAQAARQMPTAIALASAGQLTDFGVDISGAVGRDLAAPLTKGLTAAQRSLADIEGRDVESLLNRGHVALSAGRVADALRDFDKAASLAPRDPLAWLGRGLANYLGDHFEDAAGDFRRAIQLAPKSVAAHVNLAITLHELGHDADALAQWRQILTMAPSADQRREAERAIEMLQSP
jgi:tetratricopeptide (TPR) repeat protein